MGSVGDAYDNAMAERFFATLECELLHRHRFRTHTDAPVAVFDYREGFYNTWRRHSALGQLSPADYEKQPSGPVRFGPALPTHQSGATPARTVRSACRTRLTQP
jgi:Integrase core domain